MKPVRPDPLLLWPAYTLFPLFALVILFFAAAGRDVPLVVIGLGLLALNGAIVLNHLYLTTLSVAGDELVYRSWGGLQEQRVSIGAIQRIDAKRYAGAHGGVSAPYLVARGRDATVRVNTKPYRLSEIRAVLDTIRAANPRVELDEFWSELARGDEPSKAVSVTPRGRF